MRDFLRNTIQTARAAHLYRHSDFGEHLAGLPAGLFPYWQNHAQDEFKGIPTDAFFFARAAEGLMMFFDCVRTSGTPCGLPSAAADSVWHAWIAFDPEHLERFCKKHFGRTIDHTPGANMPIPMGAALANTLVRARLRAGMMRAGIGLPRLFTLDRRLGMPGGFAYLIVGGQIAFQTIDAAGSPASAAVIAGSLASGELLAAGLITQSEFDEQVAKAKSDGGGCGTGFYSSASGGECDGGGDGGGGCGGCGGGCG